MYRPSLVRFRILQFSVWMLAALLALPSGMAYAAPLGQEEGPQAETLFMGQYAYEAVPAGESRLYSVTVPEAGVYLVTAVDDVAAEAFDLIVTDANGNELYNDIFATTELTLEPGPVTLEFVAVDEDVLWFVVLGEGGSMTADAEQPGRLAPGNIYSEDRISNGRYALLTVPETAYPQQVLVSVQGGEGDIFFVSAEGPGMGYAFLSTEEDDLLRFWSDGGDYLISAEPLERRSSLTLIPFLSGRPSAIAVDTPVEAVIPAGGTETVFELPLETSFDNLTLDVASDATLGVRLVDRVYDGDVNYDSYGEPTLEIEGLFPGVYYVFVATDEAAEEDIPFTLSVSGTAGRPLESLQDGVTLEDAFAGEESLSYTFEVTQPGALVSVAIASDTDTDFDINVGLRPGETIASSYAFGSNETLTLLAPVAGTYYATVTSNGGEGPFTVTATEGDLAPALATDDVTWGDVAAGATNYYLMEVPKAGQLLSIVMVGNPDVDLDLAATSYNAEGESVAYLSNVTGGSEEAVSAILAEPGIYAVTVRSYAYEGEDVGYFLRTRLEDPVMMGGQWAVEGVASSQYGDEDYSATQATGPQDTTTPGDQPTAWAPAGADDGEETLELYYERPVVPQGVAIYESSAPGAIIAVEAFDLETQEWVTLWEGEAAAPEEAYRVFSPELAPAEFRTDQIRLVLDTAAVPGWNEIDAVQLFGRP